MADVKTWIDVVDTAVKIGLGALIGGGISYMLARLEHTKSAKLEFSKRRFETLQSAFEEISDFSSAISLYWADLNNGIFKREKGTLSDEEITEIEKAEKELYQKFLVLGRARTKLELYAESESVKELDSFRSVAEKFFRNGTIRNKGYSQKDMANTKNDLIEKRSKVMESLSNAYRSVI